MTLLYSHHTLTPAPLPHRIRLSDGSTRTDRTTFTPELLTDAGYTGPYERPSCDATTDTVDWDAEALDFLVRPYNEHETATQWATVRSRRNGLLQASDWTQIEDHDLGADRPAWASYRQALRDITIQLNPFAIDWPEAPSITDHEEIA